MKNAITSKIALTLFVVAMIATITAFGCKSEEEAAGPEQEVSNETNQSVGTYSTNQPFINTDPLENSGLETYDYNTNSDTNDSGVVNMAPENGNENDGLDVNAEVNTNLDASNQNTENENSDVSIDEDTTLLDTAEKIAEIYGTFTNRENYQNLKDLQSYVSDTMWGWLQSLMATPQNPNAPFYGVTTKAISSGYVEEGEAKTVIIVTTKREEITSNTSAPEPEFQMLLMEFVKDGEEWKLNAAYWDDSK